MNFSKIILIILISLSYQNCHSSNAPATEKEIAVGADPHSFSRPEEAATKHLDLNLTADFQKKILTGSARWTIENKNSDRIIFDTRNLAIEKVTTGKDAAEKPAKFSLGKTKEFLGQALEIVIEPGTEIVTIYYSTKPNSAALLWLEKEQTQGRYLPFLFTQGQPILTRSWLPCQDSPGIRVTYTAKVQVPPGLMAVMSAANPQEKDPYGKYEFTMDQPVPPYLIALAAGDLSFEPISQRTGIYAEPETADAARYEFDLMENMIVAAEKIFGEYPWKRYDLLVLPPSFPFGGMENPRLTFCTPTIMAGDRSLTSLVAHELAHSWSGNLVTNATWNDFWLNEGLTTYTERRIMEALYGKDYADMLTIIGYQDWAADDAELTAAGQKADTHLKLDLTGRDPDEASTDVAYDKGAHFFRLLEDRAGREKFDQFLKLYFDTYRFKTITTEEFVEFLKKNLVEKEHLNVNLNEWIYSPGIPASCPKIKSERFEKVDSAIAKLHPTLLFQGSVNARQWSAFEWIHFLRKLSPQQDNGTMKRLDLGYKLSASGNAEIQAAWFELAIKNGYSINILPQIEEFLIKVGRRKFLVPIYKAFLDRGQRETALKIYEKARPGYHSVSTGALDELLTWGKR